jgi:hypothetical protein
MHNRFLPFTIGALQLGIAGLSTYILCSANMLSEAAMLIAP